MAVSHLRTATHSHSGKVEPHPPPDPEGTLPEHEDDGGYADKNAACEACKFVATGSCAMYSTCLCYSTNTFFPVAGIPASDKDNWHWACGNEGGEKYELCFGAAGEYTDNFGQEFDPNHPKCPV